MKTRQRRFDTKRLPRLLISFAGIAVPALAGPPTIVSLAPDSGTGASVTFQAVYSDPNGAADLNEILLQVNTIQSSSNACYVYYQPQGNNLYLASDSGNAWLTPALRPGVSGTASNSQCTLNAGTSSVSMAGNDLTLNVAMTFSTTVVGSQNVYLYAAGLSGQNSGWVKEGTWTPVATAGSPYIYRLTPNMGAGTVVTFDAIYADPNGAGDLSEVLLQVNSTQSSANACYVYYQPQGNHLYLANDAGNAWLTPALTPGMEGTASNSQCTLNAGISSVSSVGEFVTLSAALTFSRAVVGARNVYLYAAGLSGQNSGWVSGGVWTPTSLGPPSIVSLTPNTGTGSYVTFKATYADPNGANDLGALLLQINTTQSSADACYVSYQPHGNSLSLAEYSGSFLQSGAPGSFWTQSSAVCTLFYASSSVVTSGNYLTLSIVLGFYSPGFVGTKNVYLYAAGLGEQNTGWLKVGQWAINPSAGPPAIVSLSPNSGNGKSVTFQAVYSDPNGAGDLDQALILITSPNESIANACYVYYQPQNHLLYLATDAGNAWLLPALQLGVAGTVSNSQCTLDAGSSSVSTAGNNMTLNVALGFNNAFAGPRNVYLEATGLSLQGTNLVKEGTWNPTSAGPPSIVSLSPNSGAGQAVTFTAVYSDPNGVGDLNELLLQMNAIQNSANGCYVYYQPQGNHLYLATNAGTFTTPALTPGVTGMASNRQCTLNAVQSSVSTAGNNLTLHVALSFSGTFVGAQNVYLYAGGLSGQNSGWVKEGTWTP
jgi:hypothetical protein